MSRSAFSLITSRLSRAISSCSGFIWPWPGKACCGSSASFFTQSRNCDTCTPRSCAACTYDTPRSLIKRTASSLNSRVNFRLSMTHLQLHQNTLTRCLRNRVQSEFPNFDQDLRYASLIEHLMAAILIRVDQLDDAKRQFVPTN